MQTKYDLRALYQTHGLYTTVKSRLIIFVLLSTLGLISLLSLSTWAQSNSSQYAYWIGFQKAGPPNGETYLMKIDSYGNTIQQKKRVIPSERVGGQGAAMALGFNNAGNIIIWTAVSTRSDFRKGKIYKAIISRNELTLLFFHITTQETSDAFRLQSTQKQNNNRVSYRKITKDGESLIGSDVNANGFFNKSQNALSADLSECEEFDPKWCPGTISSDGSAAAYTKPGKSHVLTDLWYQRLNEQGKKSGKPRLIATLSNPYPFGFNSGTIASLDISNILAGNKRFVVYAWAPRRPNDVIGDKLFVEWIEASTGNPIGEPIRINASDFLTLGAAQNVAVDPFGKFVVFSVQQRSIFGPPPINNALVFQALDALGHPSGASKILSENVSSEIDLLIDR
jgi:hypothetical protein